jgi:hypothetical protein
MFLIVPLNKLRENIVCNYYKILSNIFACLDLFDICSHIWKLKISQLRFLPVFFYLTVNKYKFPIDQK